MAEINEPQPPEISKAALKAYIPEPPADPDPEDTTDGAD